MDTVKWEDSDAPRWTSDIATVGDLLIEVCLDDEGPFRPAFFFTIERDGVRIDVCGRKMLPTTPDDVRAGVQPRCPRCPS